MSYRYGGRRGLRAQVQDTWSVYDAVRPIRQEDLAQPPEPETATPAVLEPRPLPDGGTLSPLEVTEASDAHLAKMFGISEDEVREAKRWARENAERLGSATVTGIDDGKPTVQ